jgi:hypothetical protein
MLHLAQSRPRGLVALLCLALGLLLALGWFVLSSRELGAAAPVAAEPSAAEALVVTGGVSVDPLVPPERPEGAPSRVEFSEAEESNGSHTGESADFVPVFTGRLVEHRHGVPVDSQLDGIATVLAVREGSEDSFSLPVKANRFELKLRLEDGEYLSIPGGLRLGGKLSAIDLRIQSFASQTGESFLVVGSGRSPRPGGTLTREAGALGVTVPVRRAVTVELNVLEEGTGTHLRGVEVLNRSGSDPFSMGDGLHGTELIRAGISPVFLESQQNGMTPSASVSLGVRADGYAWRDITVDFTKPGERTVELVRAGSVSVHLTGSVPRRSKLRLYRKGHRRVERAATLGTITLESLEPGDWHAIVSVGQGQRTRARGTVRVDPGLVSELTLDVQPPAMVDRATLEGSLFVPEEWAIDNPKLELRLLSASGADDRRRRMITRRELSPIEGQPGWHRFEVIGLVTGSYSITLGSLNYTQTFELTQQGLTGLEVRLPPPLDFTVVLEGELTGEDVPGIQAVFWSPKPPPGVFARGRRGASRDPATGEFRIRAPEGEIELFAGHPYPGSERIVTPGRGEKIILKVKRRPRGKVELRNGDVVVPWPQSAPFDVTRKDGGETSVSTHFSSGVRSFIVPEPGTYVLRIPKIGGFQAHPPVEIDLKRGATKTVVVELVPN